MQFLSKWQVRRLDKVSDTSDVIYNKGKKDLELEKITNEDLKAFCYLLGDHKVLK